MMSLHSIRTSLRKPWRQPVIERYFRSTRPRGFNEKTGDWHCLICGTSMGPCNSRQLCEKYWCPKEGAERTWVDWVDDLPKAE